MLPHQTETQHLDFVSKRVDRACCAERHSAPKVFANACARAGASPPLMLQFLGVGTLALVGARY